MYCLELLFAKRSENGINLARAALMTADRKPSKVTYAALKGALWSGVGQWGGAVIGLVAFIINARILGPSVIGTNAFAVSMVAFGNLVVAGVLVEALIQRKTLSDEERSAGFWISAPFGLLGIIVFPIIAMFVPGKVGEILPYCALAIPINALAAAPVAILMRDLRFKVLSTVELIAITVSSTLGVGMALNGFGVYSLVYMELTRISLRCVGAYAVSSYRPQLKPNVQAIKSVGKFGIGGLLLSLVGTAQNQIPRLAIGYFLGEAALGVFALATRLFNVLSSLVLGPLGSVALSVTGRLQDDLETLRDLYLKSIQFVSVIAMPCFLGIVAIAPILIPLAFGESWTAAIVPTQMLMLLGMRFAMTSNYVAVLRGVGETQRPLIVQVTALIIIIAGIPFAAPLGIVAVTALLMVRTLVTWPLGSYFLKQKIGVGLWHQLKAGAGAAIASILMAGMVMIWVGQTEGILDDGIRLVGGVAIGVCAYIILLLFFEREFVVSILARFRSPAGSAQPAHES